MKNLINIQHIIKQSILVLFFLSASYTYSQVRTQRGTGERVPARRTTVSLKAFKHKATKDNTSNHITTINNASSNNDASKLVFITHDYGARGPYVTQPLGVYFSGNKWRIFNQDMTPLKIGTTFNVAVVAKSRTAFIHTASAANNPASATKLNHSLLNNKPNAAFLVTQNWGTRGPYNKNHVGVKYLNGFWYIYNLSGKSIPKGAKFNVLMESKVFKHRLTTNTTSNHISYIQNSSVKGKKDGLVFATFNAQNSTKNYNRNIGVYYAKGTWSVYNENRVKLKGNEAYNVMIVNPRTIRDRRDRPRVGGPIADRVVTQTKLPNIGLIRYQPYILTSTTSAERLGPNTKGLPVDFSSTMNDQQYSLLKETFNLHQNIFKDANPRSNAYYYLPAHYSLKWSKENNKYDFNVYYMSAEDRNRGNVLVNVELTSNINPEDIQYAEQILSAKLGKRINLLPMDLRDVPVVDFGAVLTNFNVNSESVSTSVPTSYEKPIVLDWKMESNIDNFVGAMLNNSGGNVALNFKPYGDSTRIEQVPINLKVNNPITYGKIKFNTLETLLQGWTNYLDYPIFVKRLIVLRKRGGSMSFEEVLLSREKVGVDEAYEFTDTTIRNRLSQGGAIEKIWMDYEIDDECASCNQAVKRKIIGGTSGSEVANLEVQVLNALEYSKASMIKIAVKSVQGDPNGVHMIEFPAMNITEDGQSLNEIKLFVPQGEKLSYQYQVILIMEDGDVLRSKWKESDSDLFVLGESQIKKLFKDKEKNDLIDQVKDSVLGGASKEELLDKGKEILEGLFKKKKSEKDSIESGEKEVKEDDGEFKE